MRGNLEVSFIGADGYDEICDFVDVVVTFFTKDEKYKDFFTAINEAVSNALSYGKEGPEKTKVLLQFRTTGKWLAVKVVSDSKPFDVERYRRKMIESSKTMEGHWAEHLKGAEHGRGIWLMLTGAKKVIYNASGNLVILITRIPAEEAQYFGKELLTKIAIIKART
jgi:anti-sigma regulatory factor (Ser/Thr protein kinase)